MDAGSLIGYACLGLLLWGVVRFTMGTWFRRKEGTGHDVDLDTIGHRGSWSGGDIEPDTISKIERELKERAEEENQN
ncbi:MAG: hypothetical protein ACHQNE_04505 [Candidatus Kapaibacterium sp.]